MTGKGIAGFIAALALAGSSAAAPITWSFEGQVGAIDNASPATLATLSSLGVSLGSSFAGQVVFESTTPDTSPAPTHGTYAGAISSFDVTIGSFQASGAHTNSVEVDLVSPIILLRGYGSGTSSSIFDTPLLELALVFAPPAKPPSDALPLFPPELATLAPFEPGASSGSGYGTGVAVLGTDAYLFLELTRLVRVAEPGSAALLAFSLAAAGAFTRRSSQPAPRHAASRPRSGRAAGAARPGW